MIKNTLKIAKITALSSCLALYAGNTQASNWDAHWSFDGHADNSFGTQHSGIFPLSDTGSFDLGKKGETLYYDSFSVESLSIQKASDPFSISLWGLRENVDFAETLIAKQAEFGGAGLRISLDANNRIVFTLRDNQGGLINSVSNIGWNDTNDWHHLTITYDGSIQGSGVKAYFDNQPITMVTQSNNLNGSINVNSPLTIGSASIDDFEVFNGAIDEVQLNSWVINSVDRNCLYSLRDNCATPVKIASPDVGQKGPVGFQGPQGSVGLVGSVGQIGPRGVKGEQGDVGIRGERGLPGSVGAQGPQGKDGLAGQAGINGRNGRNGKDGNKGLKGPQGADGPQGAKGKRGEAGPQGSKGNTGLTGLTGATGSRGLPGARGKQGLTGYTGATGDQGKQGASGKQGIQGIKGKTGAKGDVGIKGKTGATGPNGFDGSILNGYRGDKGPTGYRGPQGRTITIWM
jgi:hypothetical protein